MISQGRVWMLSVIVCVTTSASIYAQGERVLPAKYQVDLRGEVKAPNLRPMGDGVQWEAAGARVTLPGGQGVQRPSGLSPDFRIDGDFEITYAYEILQLDQPEKGFGNGPSLYVAIDAKTGNAVSMARRVTTAGKNVFVTARTHTALKLSSAVKTKPAHSPTGKMRIERTGAKVRFFCAEGEDQEFHLITETEFSDAPITFLQIGGNPGGGEATLDIRLLSLTIRADRLPGYEAPAEVNPPAGDAPPADSRLWLYVAGAAAVVLMLAVIGALALLVLRRRATPATTKAAVPREANQRPLSFVCTECGKKLKVKPQLAGKKLKCPYCGKTTACSRDTSLSR